MSTWNDWDEQPRSYKTDEGLEVFTVYGLFEEAFKISRMECLDDSAKEAINSLTVNILITAGAMGEAGFGSVKQWAGLPKIPDEVLEWMETSYEN